MDEKLLLEYVDRVGVVCLPELSTQLGVQRDMWQKPAISLMQDREVFYCRLLQKKETLLSRHLCFCLRAVYNEPVLSQQAQDTYDWLCDNELKMPEHIQRGTGQSTEDMADALLELQQKLCVTPLMAKQAPPESKQSPQEELASEYSFLWITDEHWIRTQHKPRRYNDLSYCISEVKRLLCKVMSTREMNNMLYKGVIGV